MLYDCDLCAISRSSMLHVVMLSSLVWLLWLTFQCSFLVVIMLPPSGVNADIKWCEC